MPWRKKLGVVSVFAFGGISVILSMIRFHSLLRLISLNPLETADGVGEIMIVAALELNVAAIAVNLPAIRSIYVKYSKKHAAARSGGMSSGGISRSQTYTVSTMSKSPQKVNFELQKPPPRPVSRQPPPRPTPPSPGRTDSEEQLWSGRTVGSPTTTIWAGRDSGMQEKMESGAVDDSDRI